METDAVETDAVETDVVETDAVETDAVEIAEAGNSWEVLEEQPVVEASAMAFVEDILVEEFELALVEDLFEEEDLHSMALVARLVHLA